MLTECTKSPIFIIEKKSFLSKKRNLSLSNQQILSTSSSPNKKDKQLKLISTERSGIIESNNIIEENHNISTPIFKKGKWSEEEDNLLKKYIKKYGEGKWSQIEKGFIGRSRKQIRQRYISNIKIKKIVEEKKEKISNDLFSSSDEEEKKENKKNEQKIIFKWDDALDKIILKEYFLCKKSWVKISKKIPGTTENSVKNRFYSLLRQKVNKLKKEYKYKYQYLNHSVSRNNEFNNLILQIKKEINGDKINNNMGGGKEIIFDNILFDLEFFNSKSKRRNYSVEILLEFLPDLLIEKGINICEILEELKERKNKAANQIATVIEKHIDCFKDSNNDCKSISTDIEFDNLKNLQSEKLGIIIKNMKLKIMYKYFHRFRYNTLGI